MPEVVELHCYPIKSCAGISLAEASFSERGVAYDREWMVADMGGDFMSQRKDPELALVATKLGLGRLSITGPGMEVLSIDLADTDYKRVETTVWGNEAPAIAQSDEANEWFSDYLKQPVQLVRVDPTEQRAVKPKYQIPGASNKVGFADGASITLATIPSLEDLNNRLESPVPMNRFRPNIVIDGQDLPPFDEDFWRETKIGNLSGVVRWACARCVITDTDQATGVRGKQVLKGLHGFRKGINAVSPDSNGVFFSQNFLHVFEEGVTVKLGDEVTVIERSTERNVLEI